MKKNILLYFSLMMIPYSQMLAQCVGLQIIGFNSDNPDQILLEVISDIPGGTTFYITDNEWNGTSFNSGENITTWTAPAEGIAAGSTIFISDADGPTCGTSSGDAVPAFTTSGEEIYITSVNPSGSVAASDICFAVLFGGNGSISGVTGVDLGNIDNGFFAGGDVTNSGNWTTSNSALALGSGACAALPVELIHFSASVQNQEVMLKWQTASEKDNAYFAIEHSVNDQSFRELSQIEGAGTSNEMQEYQFLHLQAQRGNNYYRLKQVDFDGTFTYSDIEVVQIQSNDKSLTIRPTMARESIVVDFGHDLQLRGELTIYDLMGRMVLSNLIEPYTRQNTINVSNLEKGHYIIRFEQNGLQEQARFIKLD